MATEDVRPGVAIPPGAHLAEELEARSMSQSELARQMKRPVQAVNEIVRGAKAITAETALQLEEVLGIRAEVWVRLEGSYRLALARLGGVATGAKRVTAPPRPMGTVMHVRRDSSHRFVPVRAATASGTRGAGRRPASVGVARSKK